MVMVFGQMNEPPGSRFRVGHAALTMAEYFRDDEHRDVLLLIDNIFRFIQAGMEVSGLMGQMPSRLGYQPTMGTELSGLEERIANTDTGAITSIQAVYVPADDFTDPAAVHTFSHLSASIVLSRKRAGEGLYPGDRSASIQLQDGHAGHRRRAALRAWRRRSGGRSRNTRTSRTSSPCSASSSSRRRTASVVARARRLERFLTQPFFTTEQFTGLKGKLVSLEGRAGRLRANPARRIQGLPGERALHDRDDCRGEGESDSSAKPAARSDRRSPKPAARQPSTEGVEHGADAA